MFTLKDAQEKEVNKIASKRLEQQVLTLKAQLRDQAALQNQFHDLQNEVERLQAQLREKVKKLFSVCLKVSLDFRFYMSILKGEAK